MQKPFPPFTILLICLFAGLHPSLRVLAASPDTTAELLDLFSKRELFILRDRLAAFDARAPDDPELQVLLATVQLAFNQPEAAAETLASLRDRASLPIASRARLYHLEMSDHLRLNRYAEALEAADSFLSLPRDGVELGLREDVESKHRLLTALREVPPQEIEIRATSRLTLDNMGRLPIEIGRTRRRFALDTGANFSVIMESEARNLGLHVRTVGLPVATSTARKVLADVAVAEQVSIGEARLQHVVFLVFPDDLLTFEGNRIIPGLIGFPVANALGEIRFRAGRTPSATPAGSLREAIVEIPLKPPTRRDANLVFDGLELLTPVRFKKSDLVCRLDTGADQTVFYEPFYRRHRELVEKIGTPRTSTSAGVGGAQQLPVIQLPKVVLTVADAGMTLRRIDVYTQPVRPDYENYLYCNIGLDALRLYPSYIINFRDMALVLESGGRSRY